MAYIKLTLDRPIQDGESLTFKAPCDCTGATDGLKIYYKTITDSAITDTSEVFTLKDAHKNTVSNLDNLFLTDAYVKVLLDTTNKLAFIQNADTNSYLEGKLNGMQSKLSSLEVTLSSTGWSDDKEQTISNVLFVKDNYKYIVSAAYTSLDTANKCQVLAKDVTVDGKMTFVCHKAPSEDVIMQVIKLEV